MSHADPGPLATYNSLQDKHLSGYFSNSRMKRHLRRSGLVTKSGKIIDERTYRLNMVKKEHRKHVRDLLATAIVHKTLDMERMRQYEIRKRLDEVYKIELVKRVKEDRKRKGDEDILPLLSPRERTARQMHKAKQSNGDQQRPATAPSTYADYRAEEDTPLKPSELVYDQDMGKIVYRTNPSTSQSGNGYLQDETEELGPSPYTRAYSSTYPAPAPPQSGTPQHARRHSTPRRGVRLRRFHYLAKTEPAVAHRIQLQSMAEVTMKFLGPSLVLTNSMFPEDRLSDVMVLQQHCGGSTLCVFRELLPANTIFTFISRRHRGAPFGLTFYIDGLQDIRLSSCCEYKHKPGHVLGGKNGHFQFVVVEGAAPCYRCQVASSYSKNTKRKHKTSQQEGEEDQNPKAFLTETANDEEEAGETFDIIITKINPPKSEDDESKDAGEMVDDSTQTPRDDDANKESKKEGEKIETISSEEASFEVTPDETEKGGAADEPGAGEYEDDDFEKDEEKEENTSDGDTKEESENEEQETREKNEYKEDFESEDEKEEEESEVEEEKETGNKEESEGEIQDETEEVQEKSTVNEKEEEDPKEVYDETEEKMADSSDRPSSATDTEDKLSKNVSFDEEVTVIEDEKDKAAKTTEDVPEEEGAEDDKDKPEDELERNEAASDSRVEAEEVPEEQEEPRLEDQEVSKEEEEASEHPQEPLEETQDEIKQFEELILSREPDNSSSSSESSESSESSRSSEDSDNEDEENKMKKRKKKHKTKPSHDPGSDPDLVSTGKLPDQALKAVGVQPGAKHEGSVQSLLEGKKDVDLAGVSLTRKQLEEVASIVLARDYVGSVVLRNTGVDDHSVQRLCTAVKNAPTTKMLNLSLNQIGPAGARHIADVIRENKALRMLLLHGNPLTDEGVQIIVDAILETPNISLLNLDLGDCSVSDDGAKSISQLIENNRTISQLTISGNNIGHYGWQSIGEALKANSTLGTLSLDFNKIGDREAAIIAEGLRECKSLRCVDLEGNKIGDDGGRKLLEAVKANKSVIDLTLMPVNHISKDILDELKEVLEERVRKGSEAEGDGERNDIRRGVQEGDTGAEQKDEASQAREDAVQGNQEHEEQTEGEEMDPGTKDSAEVPVQGNQEHEEQTEGEEMGPGAKESTEVPVQGYQQHKEQTEGEEMDPSTKDSAEVPVQGNQQHKEKTEGEEMDPGTKDSAEVPVQGNQHDEEQTEGEELDPGPIDSAEVPIVEEFKKDEQEEVDRENDAVSDVVVGEDSDHHGEDDNKAAEEEQPSGPGEDKQEKQENMPDNPGNVPHTEETESGPQPNETEQIPPESVVEQLDTRQNPPESVPQSSVEGISRQSEAGQNPSEDFQQPSGTEQEWRLGQNVLEEGKDDYASQDSALPKDKEATHEGPTEVGESSSNEIEVDKGAQEETSLGDKSERITTTLTEQT